MLAAAFKAPHALAEEVKIPWERDLHHSQKTVTAGSNLIKWAGVLTRLCRDKINEAESLLNANTNMTETNVYEETVRTKTKNTGLKMNIRILTSITFFIILGINVSYADSGNICNEAQIRQKAFDILGQQNAIGIRYGDIMMYTIPNGKLGQMFEDYLQKITESYEKDGGDLTALTVVHVTNKAAVPVMINKKAFVEGKKIAHDASMNLCGSEIYSLNSSSQKAVMLIESRNDAYVRLVSNDYLHNNDMTFDTDKNDQQKDKEITHASFPEAPNILMYRGEGMFNMANNDVKFVMMKQKKTFFLDAKEALPIIGLLLKGDNEGFYYPEMAPLYFILEDQ